MKRIVILCYALFFISVISACNNGSGAENKPAPGSIQSCEVINGDTVNRTDFAGRKQGVWYLMKKKYDTRSIFDTVVYKDGIIVK